MDRFLVHSRPSTSAGGDSQITEETKTKLSYAQRARSERNRQRAVLLKQSRLKNRPYPDKTNLKDEVAKNKAPARVIDSGAGFLIEEEEEQDTKQTRNVVHPQGAILESEHTICDECGKEFIESYLLDKFDLQVCDKCRDKEDKHKLITKTEAARRYLLKDSDFTQREPPLKCIIRKNPRNDRWGDMKLFLELQVAERALEVWGSEETLEEEREKREENRAVSKIKKYDKKVKELRKAVRSSLWTKDTSSHEHEFGEESYNEDDDTYTKTCTSCSHSMTYEKM